MAKILKTMLLVLTIFFIATTSFNTLAETEVVGSPNSPVPERIVLNLTENPAHEIAVTWRTPAGVKNPQVEYLPATSRSNQSANYKNDPDPYKNTQILNGISETVILDGTTTVLSHSVILKDLEAGTHYQYRVGDGETWSEWAQFKTACAEETPFRFIFLGDPQNDIKSFCSRIFRTAYAAAPDARFFMVAGDLVTHPWEDCLWAELFYAAGWIPRHTPFVLAAGNHGYYYSINDEIENKKQHRFWRPHFTQPVNGPAGLEETAFYIDYQGVSLIVMNGNENLVEQSKWLEGILSRNNNHWTIIMIHQPIYSTGRDRDNPILRDRLLPLIDKYGVDLVLQGHDHTYGRTFKLREGKIVSPNQPGTVYVVSVSGPKFYPVSTKYIRFMAKLDTAIQLFQVITVDKDVIKYESRSVTGELYDSFELIKKHK